MILTGEEILRMRRQGRLVIEPFDEARVGPNSVDLLLADRLLVYTGATLDTRRPNATREIIIPPEGYTLERGVGYLGAIQGRCGSDEFVCHVDGRSSVGRLFLIVHCTAGRGDLGFAGTWCLEMMALDRPVRVYPGDRIAQAAFHAAQGDRSRQYRGRYAGQDGPVASRMWQGGRGD